MLVNGPRVNIGSVLAGQMSGYFKRQTAMLDPINRMSIRASMPARMVLIRFELGRNGESTRPTTAHALHSVRPHDLVT